MCSHEIFDICINRFTIYKTASFYTVLNELLTYSGHQHDVFFSHFVPFHISPTIHRLVVSSFEEERAVEPAGGEASVEYERMKWSFNLVIQYA